MLTSKILPSPTCILHVSVIFEILRDDYVFKTTYLENESNLLKLKIVSLAANN